MAENFDQDMEEDGEIDEDLEAMLYSQIHFQYDDSVGPDTNESHCSVNLADDVQHIFSVTPFKQDNTSEKPATRTESSRKQSLKSVDKSEQPSKCLSAAVEDKVLTDGYLKLETAEILYDKSGTDDQEKETKPNFDIEAELGMEVPSKIKNKKKKKKHKTELLSPQNLDKDAKPFSSNFIKIHEQNSPQRDYRKCLDKLLTPSSQVKTGKPTVIVGSNTSDSSNVSDSSSEMDTDTSDSCSSLNSKSTSKHIKDSGISSDINKSLNSTKTTHSTAANASGSKSSTSNSSSASSSSSSSSSNSDSELNTSSDSDVEILGDSKRDQCVSRPLLDLNWNVTTNDRKTIERIEQSSSIVEADKWKISDADLKGMKVSRYYRRKEVRCHNCNKEGHLSRDCPQPKKRPNCSLCGVEGHTMKNCTNRLCFNCKKPGHRGNRCPQPKKDLFARCTRCRIRGHSNDECTDIWRRYHLTVTSAADLTPCKKQINNRVFCCNCATMGHFAYECKMERMDRFVFPGSPFIVRYDVDTAKSSIGSSLTRRSNRGMRADTRSAISKSKISDLRSQINKHPKQDSHKRSNHESYKTRSNHEISKKHSKHESYKKHSNYERYKKQSTHDGYNKWSHDDQTYFPLASEDYSFTPKSRSQRYFGASNSAPETSESYHTQPQSRDSYRRPQDRLESITISQTGHNNAPRSVHVSTFARRFLNRPLDVEERGSRGKRQFDRDSHYDWDGEGQSRSTSRGARKRRSGGDVKNDGFVYDNPAPREKKKKRHEEPGLTAHSTSQQDYAVKGQTNQSKGPKRKQKRKSAGTPPSGRSSQGKESLVITCTGGFRTTTKTKNLVRNYRNAQQ